MTSGTAFIFTWKEKKAPLLTGPLTALRTEPELWDPAPALALRSSHVPAWVHLHTGHRAAVCPAPLGWAIKMQPLLAVTLQTQRQHTAVREDARPCDVCERRHSKRRLQRSNAVMFVSVKLRAEKHGDCDCKWHDSTAVTTTRLRLPPGLMAGDQLGRRLLDRF